MIFIEWAYIPHFYYNFYVFQYSTSLCASTAVSEKILDKNSGMSEKYVKEFLSAGGSDYAIPILKNVGVDMTTTEPYELAFAKMNKIMDEIEAILGK
jgi:oligoendopeptidase F